MNSTEQPTPSQDPQRDPLEITLLLDPAIEFSRRKTGRETSYVAHDTRTGKFYGFGEREYHVVCLLRGDRTLGEVHQQLNEDGIPWPARDLVAFVKELTQHRLTSIVNQNVQGEQHSSAGTNGNSPDQSSPSNQQQNAGKRTYYATLKLLGSLLTQRFPIVDGDLLATRLIPKFGFLFTNPAMVLWSVLVLSGFAVVWSNANAFGTEITRIFDQQLWIVLALLWCLLKVVHECGHAVCAKYHGVRVGKMGVMFFLFAPLAYVDVTDAWKLVRRRDRVQIALAGVYLEMAIGAIAALVWWFAPLGFAKHLAAQIFLVAGPATLLVNANPLLRLDGYYVLSDLLEIPNLRAHGRARLVALIESVIFRLPLPPCPLTGWRRDFAVVHALCSVVFQVVWMTGLVLAISAWAKGLGIIIAVVAALMWGVLPLVRWMHRIWTIQPNERWILNVYQRRLIAVCTIVCLIIQYLSVHSSPLSRRIPVLVRFQNQQIERAPLDSFVTAVFVRCGDRVKRGMLLMELSQPELNLKHDQLVDRREVELAKAIQYRRRGELASSRIAQQNAESIRRQLEEIDRQILSLRVLATRSGRITSPLTDRLLGSYVQQGDELLRVSDPQEKELLAIVAEDSLEAYKSAANQNRVAEVRLRGGVRIVAKLKNLQPAASRKLPHPAMAVTAGGPLAVQLAENSKSSELVHAQLQSVLPLDALTSLEVESGQIGRLTIPDDRTLVSRLWDRIQIR